MIPAVLFNDKRWTTGLLVCWSIILLVVFSFLGVLQSNFFRFGPSENLHFMTVSIDTWTEWSLLSAYCCVDTLIKSFGHDALTPWITNVIADPKTGMLPYSKGTCLAIIEIYYAYLHLSYIFHFFLSFTQFDFVLFNMLSDMLMKIYSYSSYMQHKKLPYAQLVDMSTTAATNKNNDEPLLNQQPALAAVAGGTKPRSDEDEEEEEAEV